MSQAPRILIVEDNPLDVELTRWSLANAGFSGEPIVVTDGLQAVALLKRESPYENQPLPELIILDLNLRLLDGSEVLEFIRQTPELERLPVAVLSSSPEYVMKARAARADCYFSKSSSIDAYADIGKKILDCFFRRTE